MSCTRCQLHLNNSHPCVMGSGNKKAKVMLIGEAPGYEEDRQGLPFVGPAGQLLDHILNKLGVDRSILYITNCIKCRPPKNELPKGEELDEIWMKCRSHLSKEIKAIYPEAVILFGGTALKLVADQSMISKWEGMELPTMAGIRIFAAYHPAYVLRSPSNEAKLARVLKHVFDQVGIKTNPKGLEAGLYDYDIRT